MKKKIFICLVLLVGVLSFTACGKTELNLADYVIEERFNIYSGVDNDYMVTFSSGMREENYDLDGVKNNMVEFGILTISKIDYTAMKVQDYTYSINIGEFNTTGNLTKNDYYNGCYSIDINKAALNNEPINVVITANNVSFNKELANNSKEFSVDKNAALNIAGNEIKNKVDELMHDKNNKIEVVVKITNDYSTMGVKNYYWYVGVISTNNETIGVLIDAKTGDIISKKV